MSKDNIIKIIVGIFLALAVLLGLVRRDSNDFEDIGNAPKNRTLQQELAAFYKKGQELRGEQAEPQTLTASFLAVGDIMLSRKVALQMQTASNQELPFLNMKDELDSVDFAFGNLESPFAKKPTIGGGSLIFGADIAMAKILRKYNFQVLNLANNHALDQGLAGIQLTRETLNKNSIHYTGAGASKKEAWQPAVVEKNGIKICFSGASYASVNDGGKTTNEYVARIEDLENLKSEILNLKSTCDFVVVTMHAGNEYVRSPNRAQIDFAHAAVDFGADMVIGAHPHWIQTIEKYTPAPSASSGQALPSPQGEGAKREGKYIFYSLGNFIFDQEWSKETKEGLTLKIQISKIKNQNELQGSKSPAKLESVELMPVIIENFSTPRPANQEETKKILQSINVEQPILK